MDASGAAARSAGAGGSCNWVFTLNNPKDDEDPKEWGFKYLAYQLERGGENTPHYQGYVIMNKKTRLAGMKKVNARAHWSIRMGTHEQAVAYCTKVDTRVEGPWIYGTPPEQGKRTDLLAVKTALDAGATETEISDRYFGHYLRYGSAFKKYIQLRVLDRVKKTQVALHVGPAGVGKTTVVKSQIPLSAYWKDANNNWWEGYENQQHVVMDEFTGWVPYAFFKRLLDFTPMQVEVKNGHAKFNSPYLHILSNEEPQDWYDVRHNYLELHRRIDICYRYEVLAQPPTVEWDHLAEPPICHVPNCPCVIRYHLLHPLTSPAPLEDTVPVAVTIPPVEVTLATEADFERNNSSSSFPWDRSAGERLISNAKLAKRLQRQYPDPPKLAKRHRVAYSVDVEQTRLSPHNPSPSSSSRTVPSSLKTVSSRPHQTIIDLS